ncbi:MAG: NADPH-dependent glutamate synthase [Candidatus Omnitrophica bacterium]|nr:NADPH-dependent glutamate synthase [Candidatus Omnitrophota bacterium]
MKETIHPQEIAPQQRIKDFNEVVGLYTEEEALAEAARCLQCKNPTCSEGCPVGIDIKKFIFQITRKEYAQAYLTIRQKNNFPSICGRVCPAEYQCRRACVLTKKGEPFASKNAINIHFLERFLGDYGIKNTIDVPIRQQEHLKRCKVAVVGSGPAGLCCAGELARQGVQVTVFESLHRAGGVLCYGIPPFRLPVDILDVEIEYIKKLGVEIITDSIIGQIKTIPDLWDEGYSAIFLGLGAGVPTFLGIPGENLCNVYSANEFLTRVNLMNAYKFPHYATPVNIGKQMVVIGGGNTAMDAARVALRLQSIAGYAPSVKILYRRTEIEMPARRLEIHHAREEGIQFEFLTQPVAFKGSQGYIEKAICQRCELGVPDSSGRRRPLAIAGSEFEIPCEGAILAVGLKANQVLLRVTPELSTDTHGDITVDPDSMQTSIPGVYAGGDIVGGEGTVIEAMGMAKKAARAILEYLKK